MDDMLDQLAANLRRHILKTVTDPFMRQVELMVLEIEIERARCGSRSPLKQTPHQADHTADQSD